MAIFTPAKPIATIQPPTAVIPFVNDKGGGLTVPSQQLLQQIWQRINGATAPIVCICDQTNVNLLKLTPSVASGNATGYFDFTSYRFIAASASTNTVTASVGSLSALPVYKNRGAAVAGTGDVGGNLMYEAVYASFLNGNNGGFILV